MSGRITWYIRRLAVMGPAEVVHRIKEQSLVLMLNVRYQLGILPGRKAIYYRENYQFSNSKVPVLPELEWDVASAGKEKDALLSGRCAALGYEWTWSDRKGIWHLAPDTGKQWPRRFFSSINYREGNGYGDIRLAWEPSRLQQLVSLALLAKSPASHDDKAAVALIYRQLESWIDDNPMLCGIHYISSMECALRIVAVCHSLDLVRTGITDSDRIWSKVLRMVRNHANLIHQRMSLHSSTGNHTIAESVGLIYAGILFPEFDEAKAWTDKGLGVLGNEVDRQILLDGGGVERSVWYHLFVTDLCGLALALLEQRECRGIGKIKAGFVRASAFLNVLADRPDDLPMMGDADNGYALSRYLRMSWSTCRQYSRLTIFEATGISVIRSPCGREVLYFNHGTLGMPPCYGHGHAHGLSAVIKHNNEYLLLDPGTYTYTGDAAWREYFRSTRAHNTVCVDGEDQAIQLASFMWTNAYNCKLVFKKDEGNVVALLAFHDGYSRSKGVFHWRGVIYVAARGWVIWDYLSGRARHDLEINWQTRNAAVLEDETYRLSDDVEITVSGGRTSLTPGSDNTHLGWLSATYGIKYPGKTISSCYSGDLPHEFVTRVSIGGCSLTDEGITQCLQQFKRIIYETKKD